MLFLQHFWKIDLVSLLICYFYVLSSICSHGSIAFLLLRISMHFTSDLRLKNIFKYHTQNYTAPTVCLPLQLANNSISFLSLNKSDLYSSFWNLHSKQGELFLASWKNMEVLWRDPVYINHWTILEILSI